MKCLACNIRMLATANILLENINAYALSRGYITRTKSGKWKGRWRPSGEVGKPPIRFPAMDEPTLAIVIERYLNHLMKNNNNPLLYSIYPFAVRMANAFSGDEDKKKVKRSLELLDKMGEKGAAEGIAKMAALLEDRIHDYIRNHGVDTAQYIMQTDILVNLGGMYQSIASYGVLKGYLSAGEKGLEKTVGNERFDSIADAFDRFDTNFSTHIQVVRGYISGIAKKEKNNLTLAYILLATKLILQWYTKESIDKKLSDELLTKLRKDDEEVGVIFMYGHIGAMIEEWRKFIKAKYFPKDRTVETKIDTKFEMEDMAYR